MFLHLLHRSSSSTSDCVDIMELPNLHRLSYFKDIERLNELLGKEGVDIDKRDSNGRYVDDILRIQWQYTICYKKLVYKKAILGFSSQEVKKVRYAYWISEAYES